MRNPQEEIAERLNDWRRGIPRGPYTLELYPTLRCNLDCAFCDTTYRKKRAEDEMSRDRYLRLADEAAELEVRRCYLLGGGEPMVAREITPDLMARLKGHGIYGILGTNGTLFNDALIRQLVEMQWDELHFSLDGATPEVNDFLRGQPGVFRKVTEVIRRITALKKQTGSSLPRILLHTVVTRVNYQQFADIVRLAVELGCFRVNFDAIIAYRPEQEALVPLPEDRLRIPGHAREALPLAQAMGLETTLEQFLETRALDRGHMKFPPRAGHGLIDATCLNPWHHVVVHHNGKVSPCCVIPAEDDADDLHERSLADVWFGGRTFRTLREGFLAHQLTRHCPNCSMAIIGQNDTIRSHMTGAEASPPVGP